jgi:hypothetical protein
MSRLPEPKMDAGFDVGRVVEVLGERPFGRKTQPTLLAAGDYGLLQVYGYHSAVRQRIATAADALVPGAPIGLNAAGSVFCLEALSTASTVILTYPCGFSLTSSTLWTTTAAAAFLKCL